MVVPGTIRLKRERTRTTHLWFHVHDHLAELFIICQKSLIFFSEMGRMLLQGHELLRLGARYRLRAPNDWDTTGCPQVLDRNVGESAHPISIGSTRRRSCLHPQIRNEIWVGERNILVSLHQPAVICLLKIKTKIIKSIQENNNLRKKMIERTYHKVLSMVVDELLHPLSAIFTSHVRLHKKLH